jgi:hypothetical protein
MFQDEVAKYVNESRVIVQKYLARIESILSILSMRFFYKNKREHCASPAHGYVVHCQ